ncbi:spore germination protein GerPC [Halalkalibacter urbisdiaboli]|uniref:spore germination protein GerPC n=1 Tax=Halalkalibacter urbisdiaboli TaxID=1960589 RepID=UPI000B43B8E0|nr:spore germination protein GerPC [Halalkalibacter urbisdiaboli]
MWNNSYIIQNLQHIYDCLNYQHQRITELESVVQQLQLEINTLKENQTSTIERVEYKFDQLKVERLEGTLNIGITPNNGGGSIEDFSVNQNELNVPSMNNEQSKLFDNIRQHIYEYLNEDCYEMIDSIEKQHHYQINDEYRNHIIEDIKKQIDNRIQYYLNQINFNDLDKKKLAEVEEMTINKVKEDIHKTYDEFIKHLPRGE